jgi:hypothetical protein
METKSIQRKLSSLFSLLSIILILSFSTNLLATEITRDYTGNEKVSASDLIKMETSHCRDLIINTTNDNSASYKVTIIIDIADKDKSTANKILDEIEFKIDKTSTGITMDINWPFRSFSHSDGLLSGSKTRITMRNGKKFEIDGKLKVRMVAEVNIPKENMLNLKGSHSTIQLGHLSNSAEIRVSHSTLNANDIKGLKLDASHSTIEAGNIALPTDVDLSHSKFKGLKMNKVEAHCSHSKLSFLESTDISVNLSHSDLNIDKTGNVTIHSLQHSDIDIELAKDVNIGSAQHSDVEIDNAENVIISSSQHSDIEIDNAKDVKVKNSQHGKIAVKNLNSFNFNSGGFTQIHIGTVKEKININTRHSNIIIDELLSGVQAVDIEDEFASVTVGTEKISNIDLMVDGGDHSTVNASNNLEKKSSGYYKKRINSGKVLEINLQCKHCTINIK